MNTLESLNTHFFNVYYLDSQTLAVALTVRSLESSNGQAVKAHIVQLLEVHQLKNVIIDIAQIKSLDSFGLASIISIYKHCAKQGGNIALAQPTSVVLQLFEVTRISKMINLFDTPQEANDFFSIEMP